MEGQEDGSLRYNSIAVMRHHDQGHLWQKRLLGAYRFKGLIRACEQQGRELAAGRQAGTGAVAENLHLTIQAQDGER